MRRSYFNPLVVIFAIAAVVLVLMWASREISRNMDSTAATSGSSTKPVDPGSIQDQSRPQEKSQPFAKDNAPPAGR